MTIYVCIYMYNEHVRIFQLTSGRSLAIVETKRANGPGFNGPKWTWAQYDRMIQGPWPNGCNSFGVPFGRSA
jgi:hypothetical protein